MHTSYTCYYVYDGEYKIQQQQQTPQPQPYTSFHIQFTSKYIHIVCRFTGALEV